MASHGEVMSAGSGLATRATREARMQAVKLRVLGVTQVQVTEQAPNRHGQLDHPWVSDLAPPAHEPGQGDARDAVGEQEVQVFLQHPVLKKSTNLHHVVTQFE